MAETAKWLEMKRCRTCGKKFAVLYPHLWRYKRAEGSKIHYFCSWGCLRRNDGKGKDDMKGNDQMEVARELAEAMERGEDPKEFLKSKGYANPNKAYANIKNKCMEKDPVLAERFHDRRVKKAEVVTADRLPEAEEPKKRSFAEMKKPDDARILGQEPLEVASVYSRVVKNAEYKRCDDGMMWLRRGAAVDGIMLTAYEWFKLTEEILVAIRQLDMTNPKNMLDPEEYTGNNGPLSGRAEE